MNTNLLPIGTKVHHTGHGDGVIVKYNGQAPNSYVESMLGSKEVGAAVSAGLGLAIIGGFYNSERFPYVVQFDSGYKDVYSVDDVKVL